MARGARHRDRRRRESRRNVLTSGIDLNALVGKRFRVGDVECVGVELCEPCTTLEGDDAARRDQGLVHRAGLNADILTDGEIAVGDASSRVAMQRSGPRRVRAGRAGHPRPRRDDRQARDGRRRGGGRRRAARRLPGDVRARVPVVALGEGARRLGRPAREGGVRAARAASRSRCRADAERRLGEIAREHGVWLVTGVNEVDPEQPGTIYNSLLVPRARRHARAPPPQARADEPRAARLGAGRRSRAARRSRRRSAGSAG